MTKHIAIILIITNTLFSCKKEIRKKTSGIRGTSEIEDATFGKDTLIWYHFDNKKGVLEKAVQYHYFKDHKIKSKINQLITFDKNGDTIYDVGWFYRTNLKDSIAIGKTMHEIELFGEVKDDRFSVAMCVKNNYGKEVFTDSFFNSNKDSNKLKLGLINTTSGHKVVEGFILEVFESTEKHNKDSISVDFLVEKILVRESVYVKNRQ